MLKGELANQKVHFTKVGAPTLESDLARSHSSNEWEFVALIAGEFHIRVLSCFMAKVASGWWQVAKKNNVFEIILSHCLFLC